jgi:hypothetical protein
VFLSGDVVLEELYETESGNKTLFSQLSTWFYSVWKSAIQASIEN